MWIYHSPVSSEVGEEVTIFDKLSDETEGLLDGDTTKETDHMRILSLSYFLHHLYLREEVLPFISPGRHYTTIIVTYTASLK